MLRTTRRVKTPECPAMRRLFVEIVYLSFFALAPLTFAVPRRVFCLFLRCLPMREKISNVSTKNSQNQIVKSWRGKHTLLPAGLLDLGGLADTHQPVAGLELLEGLGRVVDQGEAGGLATTELSPQAEDADLVLGGLVHGRKLLTELILGDVGAGRVQDVTVGRVQG